MRQILLYLFISFACSVNAQQYRITGTVVDEINEPIIGAKVVQKSNPENGVDTELDGNFSIEVEKGAILEFSYVGYNSKEVEVLNDSSLFIELVPLAPLDDLDLEDALVASRYCFTPPILMPNSLDFSLPESELKKLPLYDESLSGEFIQLNGHQIVRAKSLMCKAIDKLMCEATDKDVDISRTSMMFLGRYARQFLGVEHNGHKIVFINLVSTSVMPHFNGRLSDSLILVDDGGNDFGRAIVDLTSKEVIMLRMNGD